MGPSSLINLAKSLVNARVLCIGDVMLDRFVQGSVSRISPEAPIPVLKVERENAMLGGAGNVVRNVTALGGQAHLVAAVGDDNAGQEIHRLLDETDRASCELIDFGHRQTSVKTRFIAAQQQMLRTDTETTGPLEAKAQKKVLETITNTIAGYDVVILSDYGKGMLAGGIAQEIITIAEAAGKPCIVDPKGTDYSIYDGARIITPNRKELHDATGLNVDDNETIVTAAERLIKQHRFQAVLATRSEDGMTLVQADGGRAHLPTQAREVFDVSGAGDTVVATLASAMAVGAPLEAAAELANITAGIVVEKTGTAAANITDVIASLYHRDVFDAEQKLLGSDTMRDRVSFWRHQSLKIGFTNGCFDLLHPGHLALLQQAAMHCDRLIVGLNSDNSVKRLKGSDRPIQNEAARAAVLASLSMVDAVVIFEEDTPFDLIRTLAPDVLIKGADYSEDEVVGGDLVKAAGGRVVLAELEPGHSTTQTISKLSKDQ